MNKKVAAGKVKHIILRIPQKLDKSEAEGDIQMEYSCY